jgi:hypothetical protein
LAFVDFRTRALALVGLVGLVATSGCTSSHQRKQPDDGSSASSASASAAAAALAELQRQASYGEQLSFTATYRAQGSNPARSGTVTVFHSPVATRIDVGESGANVRILVTDKGTFSCKFAGTNKTPLCVTLAGPGGTVPPSVDPGLQHLFTSALDEITNGSGLRVEAAPPQTPPGGADPASCYAITAAPSSGDLVPGTYCYLNGVLVSAEFRSSSLRMTKMEGAPKPSDFALPAPPAPLASASPSTTRS